MTVSLWELLSTAQIIKFSVLVFVGCFLCYFLGIWAASPSKSNKETEQLIRAMGERIRMDAEMMATAKAMLQDAARYNTYGQSRE